MSNAVKNILADRPLDGGDFVTKPYRPSNGTSGYAFIDRWCGACQRDAAFQADPEGADGCEIVAATFRYTVDDPRYPKEWVTINGRSGCTAFVSKGRDVPEPRDEAAAVGDLFA